jgi:hypothetical protein
MAEKAPAAEQPYLAGDTTPTPWAEQEARVHKKLGDSMAGRRGDGRGRLATVRDRGRVCPVVEAETGNSVDVAERR